jgi:5'-nucleotidase
MRTTWRRRAAVAMVATLALTGAACSSDDDEEAEASASASTAEESTTTTAAEAEALEILVTNDDGYAADGIGAVVDALLELEDVEVTVVAPFKNQSGQGENTTTGELEVTEETMPNGQAATAVHGRPADAVIHALETMGLEPDLVVSGTNEGQNYGPFSTLSGTVGAAKAAVRRGVPALAVSTGFGEPPDHEVAAELAIAWVEEHREAILAGDAELQVVSINVPTCATGELRGELDLPTATALLDGVDALKPVDCSVTTPEADLKSDVEAFHAGFANESVVSHEAPPPAPIPPAA